jgi:hypothetical protein
VSAKPQLMIWFCVVSGSALRRVAVAASLEVAAIGHGNVLGARYSVMSPRMLQYEPARSRAERRDDLTFSQAAYLVVDHVVDPHRVTDPVGMR